MTSIATIYAGEGDQDVEVYATDSQGRLALPSGVTVQIVDLSLPESDATRIVLESGAATIDATNTVITSAAGPRETDARKIVVTSATGITPGRKYALSNNGRIEAFEVDRVEGLNVYATAPLQAAFPATTSSVVGLRCSATFPSAWANDADELERRTIFGVDWVFTGITGPTVVRTLARIERRGKLPRATRWDVLRIDAQIQQAQHARGRIEDAIRQADEEIDALLLHAGHVLADESHGLVASMAVRWRAVELVYQSLGEEHGERRETAKADADRWRKLLLSGRKADDQVETQRATDKIRPRRTRTTIGAI